jgi:molybdopterin-containing oxidoreductase family membrane subunit
VFFLAGAIYSGIAAMTLVALLVRSVFDLAALITGRHLAMLGWMLLCAGLATTYCYVIEFFNAAYGGDRYERAVMAARLGGTYAWSFWLVVACALLPFHALWLPRLRRSPAALATVALLAVVGLWMDRFMIIVITLHRDFLPSAEHFYTTSFWAVGTFLGTVGLFGVFLLLFMRYLPVVSVIEMRQVELRRLAGVGDD